MSMAGFAMEIGNFLRAIPAPTEYWAAIIDSLAWPALVGFLIIRFRAALRTTIDIVTARLATDHVKLGIFELTPNSAVIPLDSASAGEATEGYDPDDLDRIEKLFEFIASPDGFARLQNWIAANVDPGLDIADFMTEPEYAIERQQAFDTLVEDTEK